MPHQTLQKKLFKKEMELLKIREILITGKKQIISIQQIGSEN
jgi:hypothetical protein